jgi:predicted dehydrogenase
MRVLLVGLGSIANKHINALRVIDSNVEIVAYRSSISSPKLVDVQDIYSFSEISQFNFNFVIISNPTSLHSETIKDLIPYNLPLFIEKPLFNELTNESIINLVNDNGLKTYVACNLRFLDCLKFTKNFIKDKKINEVNSYCGSYLPDWRPGTDFRKVYSANAEMGGGVHLDLIHELDYLFWLFGKPEQTTKFLKSNSSLGIDAVDYANYVLEYDNFVTSVILNYFRQDSKRTLEILTEGTTILVDLLKNSVYENGIVIFESSQSAVDTYEKQLQNFINYINSNETSFNDINEAYQILKICL